MHVLMHVRPDWREHPGGDVVQARRWAYWLGRRGLQVTISDAVEPELRGVDLVHCHNLSRAYVLWPTLETCRRAGVPVALTPLYWPVEEFEKHGRPGLAGATSRLLPASVRNRAKTAARWLRRRDAALVREFWIGSERFAADFLKGVSFLLPNSQAELAALRESFGGTQPASVIPSGVDAFYWSDDVTLWKDEWTGSGVEEQLEVQSNPPPNASRKGILCVARFDPQKGQHRLIEALRGLNVQLTLVGADNPNYPNYRSYCRSIAGERVTILPRQSAGRLKALYQGASVFALCSWYEISALSGLEAGCCGARVVMTSRGSWREYGGDLAWYADPASLVSIAGAVDAALTSKGTPDLLGQVRESFTWEKGAAALAGAYRQILDQASGVRLAA